MKAEELDGAWTASIFDVAGPWGVEEIMRDLARAEGARELKDIAAARILFARHQANILRRLRIDAGGEIGSRSRVEQRLDGADRCESVFRTEADLKRDAPSHLNPVDTGP